MSTPNFTAYPTERRLACSVLVRAEPSDVFAVWADVARWHEWDPDTRAAQLSGPFAVGSTGRLTPAKGRAVPMRLAVVVPDERFVVECAVLGNRMSFDHRIAREPAGVRVTHELQLSGWAAGLLWRMLAPQLKTGLPITMSGLRERCEGRGTQRQSR